jgi:hypothetical protein
MTVAAMQMAGMNLRAQWREIREARSQLEGPIKPLGVRMATQALRTRGAPTPSGMRSSAVAGRHRPRGDSSRPDRAEAVYAFSEIQVLLPHLQSNM